MPSTLLHIGWFEDTGERIKTQCGRIVQVWQLKHEADDAAISAWAKHFRQHYCDDEMLSDLAKGTGKNKSDFLLDIKFPDAKISPGPSIRAGDFAEILVADYIEYILGYWCPRQFRYDHKFNRNESAKGCDVIGFKFVSVDGFSSDDELIIFESKAALSKTNDNRLQSAVDDSAKDSFREAMSLSALKQRFLEKRATEEASRVERFQNILDFPFKRINGSAAVLSEQSYDAAVLAKTDASNHPNSAQLILLAIRGSDLMALVHALYERAANEA
jgi:hypothetical protein